jgi:hypothetical protein
MRRLLSTIAGCLLSLTVSLCAQQQKALTDAQMDGFSGPVKSVVTSSARLPVEWQQPGGPSLVWLIPCRDCDYAPDGSKIRAGQVENGRFHLREIS